MPALGRLHAVAAARTVEMRDAQTRPRPNDADRALAPERHVRPGKVQELAVIRPRDRMGDRGEIIDDGVLVRAELFGDQRGADDPRVVGEADHRIGIARAADRPGDGDADRRRERAALAFPIGFPRGLETGVIGGLERLRLVERDRPVAGETGNRKAGMGPADIDHNHFAHCSLPARKS